MRNLRAFWNCFFPQIKSIDPLKNGHHAKASLDGLRATLDNVCASAHQDCADLLRQAGEGGADAAGVERADAKLRQRAEGIRSAVKAKDELADKDTQVNSISKSKRLIGSIKGNVDSLIGHQGSSQQIERAGNVDKDRC